MKQLEKIPKRSEVKKEDTWAMKDMFASDSAWETAYQKLNTMLGGLEQYQGRLGGNGEILLDFLRKEDEISLLLENVYVYANQKYHEDTQNAFYQNMVGKAQTISSLISEKTSFALPEILEIPEEELKNFITAVKGMDLYEIFIRRLLRKKNHILSKEQEAILAATGELAQAPDSIYSMFSNADLKLGAITDGEGRSVPLTDGRYINYIQSSDRRVRKEAFQTMMNAYAGFKNTVASLYQANVKQDIFYTKARHFSSTLEKNLFENEIPVSVYHQLIQTVDKNLPLLHRYVDIKKRALGLEKIHMYDLYCPIVADADQDVPYGEAKKIVKQALAPLGEKYIHILQEGFDNRWIDVYENEGKRSGAYSWGAYGTHPYVLLNYSNNLKDVFTLAHEMGHALHSYFSDQNQPFLYAGYKIFVAEVASTCNEALLMDYLLSQTQDKKQRAYLINYFMEQFRTTLFRQTMFAEFEMLTHKLQEEGETLTADVLCSIYYDLNKKYFGDTMEVDSEIAIEWARIPHFYTPFYVYQYATGYSAAIAISRKILNGDKQALEGYFKFLSSGSSSDPISLLKLSGVDMNTKEPIDSAMQLFKELLDEFETGIL